MVEINPRFFSLKFQSVQEKGVQMGFTRHQFLFPKRFLDWSRVEPKVPKVWEAFSRYWQVQGVGWVGKIKVVERSKRYTWETGWGVS